MCTMLKFLEKLKLQTNFCTLLYLYVSGYSFASATAVTCCEKRPEPREMGTWIKEHISPFAHTHGGEKTTKKDFPLRGEGGNSVIF